MGLPGPEASPSWGFRQGGARAGGAGATVARPPGAAFRAQSASARLGASPGAGRGGEPAGAACAGTARGMSHGPSAPPEHEAPRKRPGPRRPSSPARLSGRAAPSPAEGAAVQPLQLPKAGTAFGSEGKIPPRRRGVCGGEVSAAPVVALFFVCVYV